MKYYEIYMQATLEQQIQQASQNLELIVILSTKSYFSRRSGDGMRVCYCRVWQDSKDGKWKPQHDLENLQPPTAVKKTTGNQTLFMARGELSHCSRVLSKIGTLQKGFAFWFWLHHVPPFSYMSLKSRNSSEKTLGPF